MFESGEQTGNRGDKLRQKESQGVELRPQQWFGSAKDQQKESQRLTKRQVEPYVKRSV